MKKRWVIAPVVAGAMAIGGMAAMAEDSGKLTPVETAEAKVKQVASGWISADEAKSIALEAAGGGEVIEMEFDRDDRTYEFEIAGESGDVEVDIDASNGKVLQTDRDDEDEDEDDRDDEATEAPDNLISEEEAIEIAKGEAGEKADVTDVELDEDDNRWHYEMELRDGQYEYEVTVDAESGEVLDFEKDED